MNRKSVEILEEVCKKQLSHCSVFLEAGVNCNLLESDTLTHFLHAMIPQGFVRVHAEAQTFFVRGSA